MFSFSMYISKENYRKQNYPNNIDDLPLRTLRLRPKTFDPASMLSDHVRLVAEKKPCVRGNPTIDTVLTVSPINK